MMHTQQNTAQNSANNATSQYRLRNRVVNVNLNGPLNNNMNAQTQNVNTAASSNTQRSNNTAPKQLIRAYNGCEIAGARFKAAMDAYHGKPYQPWKGLTIQLPDDIKAFNSTKKAPTLVLPKTPQVISPFPIVNPPAVLLFSPVHFSATAASGPAVFSPLDDVKMYTNKGTGLPK